MKDGYIKFKCDWEKAQPIDTESIQKLNKWRDKLYSIGLVGAYSNGIGFGNLSQRSGSNQFIITGSQTGTLAHLSAQHYCKVITADIKNNSVVCKGLTIASSESMSHAIIYQLEPEVHAIFHVHHKNIWSALLYKIPTTSKNVCYGSPSMAFEIKSLLQNSDLRSKRILAMAGHEDGLISFGSSLDEAGNTLLNYCKIYLP